MPAGSTGADVEGARRLASLQVLRFLAALVVTLFHAGAGLQQERPGLANPFAWGGFGVDVFFVLSGFIIAHTWRPTRGMADFAWRRVARVVPLYWTLTLGLALVALVAPSLLNSTTLSWGTLVRSLLFVPTERADGVVTTLLFLGWTLAYEMWFYAIFCVAHAVRGRTVEAALALVAALVLAGQLLPFDGVLWRFYTDPVMVTFALGMGLSLAWTRLGSRLGGRNGVAILLLAVAMGSVVAGWAAWVPMGHAVAALAVVLAFLMLDLPRNAPTRALVALGDASYSLYLGHPYVLQVPVKLLGDRLGLAPLVGVMVAAVAAALLASLLLFRLVEMPGQRLVMRMRRALGPPAAGTTGTA